MQYALIWPKSCLWYAVFEHKHNLQEPMPKISQMYTDSEEIPSVDPASLPHLFPSMQCAATLQPKPVRAFAD